MSAPYICMCNTVYIYLLFYFSDECPSEDEKACDQEDLVKAV